MSSVATILGCFFHSLGLPTTLYASLVGRAVVESWVIDLFDFGFLFLAIVTKWFCSACSFYFASLLAHSEEFMGLALLKGMLPPTNYGTSFMNISPLSFLSDVWYMQWLWLHHTTSLESFTSSCKPTWPNEFMVLISF